MFAIFLPFLVVNVESSSFGLDTDFGLWEDNSITIEVDKTTIRMLVEKMGNLEDVVLNIYNRNKELDKRNRELEHELANQRDMIDDLQSTNKLQNKALVSLKTLLKQNDVENKNDPQADDEVTELDVKEEATSFKTSNVAKLNDKTGFLPTHERSIRQEVSADKQVAFFALIPNTISNLGVEQVIEFGSATTNVGNAFNSKTGIFTAPYPGTYVFSVSLMGNSKAPAHYYFAKNHARISYLYVHGTESLYTTTSHTVILQLNQGDDVEIRNIDAGQTVYGDNYSCFSGFLLYPGNNAGIVVG